MLLKLKLNHISNIRLKLKIYPFILFWILDNDNNVKKLLLR